MESCLKTTEQQALEFITFCTEMYAGKKNISGSDVAKLFCNSGVFDFFGGKLHRASHAGQGIFDSCGGFHTPTLALE